MKKTKICLFLFLCTLFLASNVHAKIQMIGGESDLSFSNHDKLDSNVNAGNKKCSDKGYLDAIPAGQTCTPISYAGNSCYTNCKNDSCPSGSTTACNDNQVQTNTTWTDSGKACYECRAKVCSDYEGFKDRAEAEETCTPITPYTGLSCVYNCKSDSCSKGTLTACNDKQIQISTSKTASGKTCYECRAKTCADGGYVDSEPAGQTCTSVIYGDKLCYSGCKQNCGPTLKCDNGCKTTCGGNCVECNPCQATVNCSWGCKKNCGGNCVECYPACSAGYKYGFTFSDCYISPAKMMMQPSNPNCGKCVCDNSGSNCGGRPCECMIF